MQLYITLQFKSMLSSHSQQQYNATTSSDDAGRVGAGIGGRYRLGTNPFWDGRV
jgi:hypothetical protein